MTPSHFGCVAAVERETRMLLLMLPWIGNKRGRLGERRGREGVERWRSDRGGKTSMVMDKGEDAWIWGVRVGGDRYVKGQSKWHWHERV